MSRVRNTRILLATTALSALVLAAIPAAAQSDRGAMGGGFIEFLMTGSAPMHRQGAPRVAMPAPRPQRQSVSVPLHTGSIGAPRQIAAYAAPPSGDYRLDDPMVGQPMLPRRGPEQTYAPAPVEGGTFDPRFERQEVTYTAGHGAGTVVVDTSSRYLYLVLGNGRAMRYGIGVGRQGFEWRGTQAISRKAEWPDWRPPAQMLKRRPDLPRFMAGGLDNPLGARALYLGSSLYRIHGTNEPQTIGQAVSSGCIRMRNEDVTDLYNRVRVGTRVVVM